jgi:hypothetical protein
MSDFKKTVEEAARLLDERAVVFEEQTRARMLGAARALRSGLAPALDRARQEERERWLPVLAALERLTNIYENEIDPGDPPAERPAWLRDALALRTITAPPPPGTETPPTPPAFAPLMGCDSSVLATATAPERDLPRTEPDGRRTGDRDCPACDAADAGGRRGEPKSCGTCRHSYGGGMRCRINKGVECERDPWRHWTRRPGSET